MQGKLHTVDVPEERLEALDGFLRERLDLAHQNLQQRLIRYGEIDALLDGEQSRVQPTYDGASRVVTTTTQARTDSVAERVFEAFSSGSPVARISAVTGRDSKTGIDWHGVSREATDWFDYNWRMSSRLNGHNVSRANIGDLTRYGICGIKVLLEKDTIKGGFYNSNTGAWEKDVSPRETYAGPRWFYVSPRDMLWPEGYGQDIQSLPFFAQLIRYSWSAIQIKVKREIYDPNAVSRIQAATYKGPAAQSQDIINQEMLRTDYEIAEVWVNFDIDGDGIEESLIVDWHLEARQRLRCAYNPFRSRPIYVARLRERSSTSFDGKGIPDILRSSQDEMDRFHNLGLDAGRVALKSARLIRMGSALASMLTDPDVQIGPDFEAVTENPTLDLSVVPLGDPGPAMLALRLTTDIENAVNKLVGIGPGQLGDISLAPRSAASGIGQLLHEGGFFTRGVSSRYAEAFREAVIQTFEVVRRNPNLSQSYVILGDDGAHLERLFSLAGPLEYIWAVKIGVADPSDSPDAFVQRNLIVGQFMLSWLREVATLVGTIGSAQVEESVKVGLAKLAVVSEEIVHRIIENSKDMQDLTPILPGLQDLLPKIAVMAAQERAEKERAEIELQDAMLRRQGMFEQRAQRQGGTQQ
jgi:hypothetical protein